MTSLREWDHLNTRGSNKCQEEARTWQAHLFGSKKGASESLAQDSLSVATQPLWDSCQETAALPSHSYRTPAKRLQHSYRIPATRLQHSYSALSGLLHHCCQETTAHLQDVHQQNDQILEFPPSVYLSHPTWGYCLLPALPNKNPPKNGKSQYQWLASGGILWSSKIRCEETKVHRVCPNWKQQGLHWRMSQRA